MKNIIIILLAVGLFLSAGIASAKPGIYVTVVPIKGTVMAGEVAEYNVIVSTLSELGKNSETVDLSITNQILSWNYLPSSGNGFSSNGFSIGPHPDVKTVTLKIGVSGDSEPGLFAQTVYASTTYVDPDLGTISGFETSDFTTYVGVTAIPEFPTVALPIVSALGIVFLMSRRKERS